MITQIRIPARWARSVRDVQKERSNYDVAVFNLGIGPCGKTVIELHYSLDAAGVTVYQVCSDTERKSFFYPMHTLTGRVEILEE